MAATLIRSTHRRGERQDIRGIKEVGPERNVCLRLLKLGSCAWHVFCRVPNSQTISMVVLTCTVVVLPARDPLRGGQIARKQRDENFREKKHVKGQQQNDYAGTVDIFTDRVCHLMTPAVSGT